MSRFWKWVAIVSAVLLVVLIVLVLQYKWVSENDKNGDGQVDEWMRFNLMGERIEFSRDKNYDGKIDYIESYEKDQLVQIKADFDYDGLFETISYYNMETGAISRLERDRNGDGKLDKITTYDYKGKPLRKESDEDFDGIFEKKVNTEDE